MTDNCIKLFCLVDGEALSNAFPVEIESSKTIGDLKEVIKSKKKNDFQKIDANKLTLRLVLIPDGSQQSAITPKALDDKTGLDNPRELISERFPESPDVKTYILVQRPTPDQSPPAGDYISQKRSAEELDLPASKKIRLTEGWKQFKASDGTAVALPPSWIDILASTDFVPEPRAAFNHLKKDLQAGDSILVPSMGQTPKDFGRHGLDHRLFVTEQMLGLWEDMRGDQKLTYRRVLSGPMGVGKTYLSYFLAARAYAEGWLVLYLSDTKVLDRDDENEAALALVKRFLALNKDILTGAEMEMLIHMYNGTRDISRCALSVIFDQLLKSRDRKTLLLVDEHGGLFEREPYLPYKFSSLVPLMSFNWWGEDAKGFRLIFTGTAHAKYEMKILHSSFLPTSVVYVGPLSENVFSKLLNTYPTLAAPAIQKQVTEITGRVPRELMHLSDTVDPITTDNLQEWAESRTKYFLHIAREYHQSRNELGKQVFYNALLMTFLGGKNAVDYEWDFVDLGLIYRSKEVGQIGTQYYILCRPAQKALLELFKTLPLPEETKNAVLDGTADGPQFEQAVFHQLIRATKPVLLNATDLNNGNPTTISLDFTHFDTMKAGKASLGLGYDSVLARCSAGHARFDFMLGPMLIQVSISDFGAHNRDSADLRRAFSERVGGTNQIERYLNDMFGPGHSATIENYGFAVTKNGVPVPGFRIVYIRGHPGKPAHRDWVKRLPDVLYVTFEEIKEKLFKNIV